MVRALSFCPLAGLQAAPPARHPPRAPDPGSFCVCARARRRAPPGPLTCGGGHSEPEKEAQPQLHEPRSGAGAPRRRTGACGRQRALGPGTVGLTLQLQMLRGRPLARRVPGCGQESAATVTNFRARCPSRLRAAGCGLGLFWLPHHPFRLPAPRRGWSCSAGAFEPRAHGARPPSWGRRGGVGPAGLEEPPQEAARASTLLGVPGLFSSGGTQSAAGGQARRAARAAATTSTSG